MSASTTDTKVSAPSAPPKTPGKSKKSFRGRTEVAAATEPKWKAGRALANLTPFQVGLAVVILLFWLQLFAGGMLVDTQPYRCAISWSAIDKINPKTINDHPCSAFWLANPEGTARVFNNRYGVPEPAPAAPAVVAAGSAESAPAAGTDAAAQPAVAAQAAPKKTLPVQPVPLGELAWPWVLTILFYTPLNLAFVSASAGVLGSLGSIANLNDDTNTTKGDRSGDAASGADNAPSRDRTNPIISGLLRGMFVYLFMISGMLLFDDSPFSATGPDQYVRLAGFLSLFSFVVNYQPNIFGTLIEWANNRIQSKNRPGATMRTQGEVEMEAKARFNVTPVTDEPDEEEEQEDAAPDETAPVRADEPSRNGHSNGSGSASAAG